MARELRDLAVDFRELDLDDHFTSALSRSLSPENAQYIRPALAWPLNPSQRMTEAPVISHFAKDLFVIGGRGGSLFIDQNAGNACKGCERGTSVLS